MPESSFRQVVREQLSTFLELLRWIPITALAGILAGSASALLLVSLNYATALREGHVWLVLLLAPAGFLVGLMYRRFGISVEAGNNLILEETHNPKATIPLRMTPLILIGDLHDASLWRLRRTRRNSDPNRRLARRPTRKAVSDEAARPPHSAHGRHQRGVRLRLRNTTRRCSLWP